MVNTTARIKKHGKNFEIIVDLDKALKFKKEDSSGADFLETDSIFTDSKKGFKAPDKDLEEAFGTTDVNTIAQRIVKEGEILLTQEYRDDEKEKRSGRLLTFCQGMLLTLRQETHIPLKELKMPWNRHRSI